jgi:hypothetical protein
VRAAQLLLSPAVAAVAALRGRWPGVLLAAIAVRLLLDPQDNGYYEGTAVLAAVVADLGLFGWTAPWAAAVTAVMLWHPFVADFAHRFETARGPALLWFRNPEAVTWVHVVWAVLAAAAVLAGPLPRRGERTAVTQDPPGGRTQPRTSASGPAG